MKPIIKTTRVFCLCKIEKVEIVFYKTGGLCKNFCSQKVPCPTCNIGIKFYKKISILFNFT